MPKAVVKEDPKKARLVKQGAASNETPKSDKPKRAKQTDLPGMENREIPEIEQAAENYRDVRDQRIELSKDEATAKASLIAVMKAHKREVYNYNGLSVNLEHLENVKVKTSKKDEDEDDE